MSCSEILSLLSLRSLDLLEGEERDGVEAHLASCAACRLEVASHDDLAAYLRTARKDERPPERVWEGLAKTLGTPVAGPTVGAKPLLELACATCQGGLIEAVYCASCLAPHHKECFTRCAVHGCKGTRIVSARRPPGLAIPLITVGVAAIAAIAVLQREYEARLETQEQLTAEMARNVQLEKDLRKLLADKKPAIPTPPPVVTKKKDAVSVHCESEDLGAVLDRIGQQCEQNIVVDPSVHEKVTVTLKDVPWRDAVDVIAQFAKCEVVRRGDVLVLERPLVVENPRERERIAPSPIEKRPTLQFPNGREILLDLVRLEGVIEGERLVSTVVVSGRSYHLRDQLLGNDKKPLSPPIYVVEIKRDEVALATGSLDGPRAVLAIGH